MSDLTKQAQWAGDKLASAAEQFEKRRQSLYQDGKPLFAEWHAEEKLAEARKPVQKAAEQAMEIVAQLEDELAKAQRAADADPTSLLSEAELERANARREFVKEEAAELPLDAIMRRLMYVKHEGDKVEQWLYHRYLSMNLDRFPADEQVRLIAALEELKSKFVPERNDEKVTAKREAARDLRRQVATTLDDVTGAREERIKKRLGRYPVSPGTFEQLTRS